jgi:hypothetical protein
MGQRLSARLGVISSLAAVAALTTGASTASAAPATGWQWVEICKRNTPPAPYPPSDSCEVNVPAGGWWADNTAVFDALGVAFIEQDQRRSDIPGRRTTYLKRRPAPPECLLGQTRSYPDGGHGMDAVRGGLCDTGTAYEEPEGSAAAFAREIFRFFYPGLDQPRDIDFRATSLAARMLSEAFERSEAMEHVPGLDTFAKPLLNNLHPSIWLTYRAVRYYYSAGIRKGILISVRNGVALRFRPEYDMLVNGLAGP